MNGTATTPAGAPHLQVANHFLAQRGYRDATPLAVDRVDGEYRWYLDYDLDEGRLVLEVRWHEDTGWRASVWDFELESRSSRA